MVLSSFFCADETDLCSQGSSFSLQCFQGEYSEKPVLIAYSVVTHNVEFPRQQNPATEKLHKEYQDITNKELLYSDSTKVGQCLNFGVGED
jgi:hypothetical protein